jgi:hypothetical protein
MAKAAIKTLELQALEALRQAAEHGTTSAARESCLETALSAMRGAELLRPRPRAKKKRRR